MDGIQCVRQRDFENYEGTRDLDEHEQLTNPTKKKLTHTNESVKSQVFSNHL